MVLDALGRGVPDACGATVVDAPLGGGAGGLIRVLGAAAGSGVRAGASLLSAGGDGAVTTAPDGV